MARKVWQMTADEFIGPAIVSDIFEIEGSDENYALVWEALEEGGQPELWRSADGSARIVDLEWGENGPAVALEVDGEGMGFYLKGQSWVHPGCRGRGLGTEMVLAAAGLCEGSPAANTQGMGYSEAGWALHARAHRVAVERALAAGLPVPRHVIDGASPTPVGTMGTPAPR